MVTVSSFASVAMQMVFHSNFLIWLMCIVHFSENIGQYLHHTHPIYTSRLIRWLMCWSNCISISSAINTAGMVCAPHVQLKQYGKKLNKLNWEKNSALNTDRNIMFFLVAHLWPSPSIISEHLIYFLFVWLIFFNLTMIEYIPLFM